MSFIPEIGKRFAIRIGMALVLGLSGCVANPPVACQPGERLMTVDTLYFGAQQPEGAVSATEWRDFVDLPVTPRFPAGLPWWEGRGQWRTAHGEIQGEASFILRLIHEDARGDEQAVRAIADVYKARFRQESVLRVRHPACVLF